MKKIAFPILFVLLLLSLNAQVTLTNIRFGNYDFGTRVVVETSGKTGFQITDDENEVILRVLAPLTDEKLKTLTVGAKNITDTKVNATEEYTQITIQAKSLYRSISFPLSGDPYKIVVDILFAPGGYTYKNGLGIARYLLDKTVTADADAEFEKLEKMFPQETGFYYYYGLNALHMKDKNKAKQCFQKVSADDSEYGKAVAELKKMGVTVKSVEKFEKPKEIVPTEKKEDPVVEPIVTEEPMVTESEPIDSSASIPTILNDKDFFKSPFWYLSLTLFAIVILSTIYFLIQQKKLKAHSTRTTIDYEDMKDQQSKRDTIRKLYNQGWSVRAISKELNIDQEEIYITIEEDSVQKES
jgi:tetratricopeptide (TPR) repeat protein